MPIVALPEQSLEARAAAARQLATWLSAGTRVVDGGSLEVRECFPVCTANIDKLRGVSGNAFGDVLEPLGRWHVQVALNDRPYGYARLVEAADGLRVRSWSRGALAGAVDAAITTADAELPHDAHVVVLLEVAPLNLSALVFVPHDTMDDTWILPLVVPRRFTQAALGRIFRAEDLLAQARDLPTIQGFLTGKK